MIDDRILCLLLVANIASRLLIDDMHSIIKSLILYKGVHNVRIQLQSTSFADLYLHDFILQQFLQLL